MQHIHPMTPSEIRTELLRQHLEIRRMIQEVRDAIATSSDRPTLRAQVPDRLLQIVDELFRHNRCEEDMLRTTLQTIDAWGQVHVDGMDEQHVGEHRSLLEALLDARASLQPGFEEGVLSALSRVLKHMAREEATFLSEDVLRDDSVVIHQMGG